MRHWFLDLRRTGLLLKVGVGYAVISALQALTKSSLGFDNSYVRFRKSLETLGLTYLKLGQFLAMRFDLLNDTLRLELDKLFEHVEPMSFADVKQVIEGEFDQPLNTIFNEFDAQPLASASVAQVHHAYTRDGEKVAVKVQRLNVERIFEADMRNIRRVAQLVDWLQLGGVHSIVEAVDEFDGFTRREMNFIQEGKSAEYLRQASKQYAYAPEIYWDYSTRRVLTMEFIEGVSLLKISQMIESGGDIEALLGGFKLETTLRHLVYASLHQIFILGFFHGDPHPGNIFVQAPNDIVFLDFGIFGEFSEYQRISLGRYLENLGLGNLNTSFYYYSKLFIFNRDSDVRRFTREEIRLMRSWYEASLQDLQGKEQFNFVNFAFDEAAVLEKNRVRMRLETLLFWRAMFALNTTILRLSPQTDFLGLTRDFFAETSEPIQKRIQQIIGNPLKLLHTLEALQLLREQNYREDDALFNIEHEAGYRNTSRINGFVFLLVLMSVFLAFPAVDTYWLIILLVIVLAAFAAVVFKNIQRLFN